MNLPKAIVLLGPTASGKTALAMYLADRFPVEIVSVDSALVYREMNIGTAKPDADTLRDYPHHLINLIDPTETYSAARFRQDAMREMTRISSCGRIPLLVGGTMLYAKALFDGLSALPEADAGVRAEIEARALKVGWPAMHAELGRIDPPTAARLKPADAQRIQRALEVYRLTGMPVSVLQTRTANSSDFPYAMLKFGLMVEQRSLLHERIAARFDVMLAAGLIDELRGLRKRYALDAQMPSMRCVGYRQAWQFLDGNIDARQLREQGVAATRQLAKRQITWLRAMQDLERLDCFQSDLQRTIATRVTDFLQTV